MYILHIRAVLWTGKLHDTMPGSCSAQEEPQLETAMLRHVESGVSPTVQRCFPRHKNPLLWIWRPTDSTTRFTCRKIRTASNQSGCSSHGLILFSWDISAVGKIQALGMYPNWNLFRSMFWREDWQFASPRFRCLAIWETRWLGQSLSFSAANKSPRSLSLFGFISKIHKILWKHWCLMFQFSLRTCNFWRVSSFVIDALPAQGWWYDYPPWETPKCAWRFCSLPMADVDWMGIGEGVIPHITYTNVDQPLITICMWHEETPSLSWPCYNVL